MKNNSKTSGNVLPLPKRVVAGAYVDDFVCDNVRAVNSNGDRLVCRCNRRYAGHPFEGLFADCPYAD